VPSPSLLASVGVRARGGVGCLYGWLLVCSCLRVGLLPACVVACVLVSLRVVMALRSGAGPRARIEARSRARRENIAPSGLLKTSQRREQYDAIERERREDAGTRNTRGMPRTSTTSFIWSLMHAIDATVFDPCLAHFIELPNEMLQHHESIIMFAR
jgi:hypothetical protein